jgi:hypothetical protein
MQRIPMLLGLAGLTMALICSTANAASPEDRESGWRNARSVDRDTGRESRPRNSDRPTPRRNRTGPGLESVERSGTWDHGRSGYTGGHGRSEWGSGWRGFRNWRD